MDFGWMGRWIHSCLEGRRGELLIETCGEEVGAWMRRCKDGVLGDQAGVSCQPGGGGQLVGWVGRCVNRWTNEWTRGQMDTPSGLGVAG